MRTAYKTAAALFMMAVVSGFPVMLASRRDLKGAVDTSNVSSSDLLAAVVVAVLTAVVAWLVGRATRRYLLGRPDSDSVQIAGMTARARRRRPARSSHRAIASAERREALAGRAARQQQRALDMRPLRSSPERRKSAA